MSSTPSLNSHTPTTLPGVPDTRSGETEDLLVSAGYTTKVSTKSAYSYVYVAVSRSSKWPTPSPSTTSTLSLGKPYCDCCPAILANNDEHRLVLVFPGTDEIG